MAEAETKYSIWGLGREFIIGTLSEDEAQRITDDEDLEEILGDVHEIDNVMHIYGPDIDEVVLKDQNDAEVEFKRFSFNIEPTWDFRVNFEETLNEQISSYLEDIMEIPEEYDFKNDFQELTNIFQEKPEEKLFLIQDYVEKGYWGDITIEGKNTPGDIILVGLELEGMSTYVDILLGYLIVKNGSFEFTKLDYEPSTDGKGLSSVGYDNNLSNTIWES